MNAPTGPIFMKDANAGLKPFAARDGYATEDELQLLIATHPELLRGDQIDPDDPRRWLLLDREVGIPGRGEAVLAHGPPQALVPQAAGARA
jgi:hypothetical protein